MQILYFKHTASLSTSENSGFYELFPGIVERKQFFRPVWLPQPDFPNKTTVND
jgi:hypothetical protein